MKKIILFLVCFFSNSLIVAQTSFSEVQKQADNWFFSISMSLKDDNDSKKVKYDFPNWSYSIEGSFEKGKLVVGQMLKIYDTKNVSKQILVGKVMNNEGGCVVQGIRYIHTAKGVEKIYGSFSISNADKQLIFKPKKAGNIEIHCLSYEYYLGYYLNCPTMIVHGDLSTIYVDGETGGRGYKLINAILPEPIENCEPRPNPYDILLKIKEVEFMTWPNGDIFKGIVNPIAEADSVIYFDMLEGNFSSSDINVGTRILSKEMGRYVFTKKTNFPTNSITKQTFYMPEDFTPNANFYWVDSCYILNCERAKIESDKGYTFEGQIKSSIIYTSDSLYNISYSYTNGVLFYKNGDTYEGSFDKCVGPFFVSGKTKLASGEVFRGNWLDGYKLTEEQWNRVFAAKYPSDAYKLLNKYEEANNYVIFKRKKGTSLAKIYYFDMQKEKVDYIYCEEIRYEINTDIYHCYSEVGDKSNRIEVILENGTYNPIQQEVYKDSKLKYIITMSWYANDQVEHLKVYDVKTNYIAMSLNFYSDGKLRSAYVYGIGNNGKNVLRKSKEAHPDFDFYTVKMFDLNGNYERSGDWDIGERKDYFWGTNIGILPQPLPFELFEESE